MKRAVGIAAALVVLLIITVLVLPFVVDLDSYKDRILPPIEEALGRKVEVGHINLSILSGVGIDLSHLVIANDPQFGAAPLLEVADFQIRIALLPLLHKELRIKRVFLDHPILRVVKNPTGRANVTVLLPRAGRPVPREKKPEPEEKPFPAAPFPITALVLSDLVVRGGKVVYTDRSREGGRPRVSEVSNLNLTVTESAPELPMNIDFSLSAPGSGRKSLTLSGKLGPLDGDWKNLQMDLTGGIFLGDALKIYPELRARLPGTFSGSGRIGIRILSSRGRGGAGFLTTVDLSRVAMADGKLLRKSPGIPLEGRFLLAPPLGAEGPWRIRKLEGRLGPVRVSGEGTVRWGNGKEVELTLRSDPFPLNRLGLFVPALKSGRLAGEGEFQGEVRGSLDHLGKVRIDGLLRVKEARARWSELPRSLRRIEGVLRFTGRELSADGVRLEYGSSPGVLSARMADWESPRFRYELSFPQLRLPVERAPAIRRKSGPASPLVLTGLAAFGEGDLSGPGENVSGELRIKRGSWDRFEFSDLRIEHEVTPGRLWIKSFSLRALGGAERGSLRYDLRRKIAPWTLQADLSNVDARRLLATVWPHGPRGKTLRGSLNAKLALAGRGLSRRMLDKNLKGSGTVAIDHGRLEGVDLVQTILDHLAQAPALKGMIPSLFPTLASYMERGGTSFDRVQGEVNIARGSFGLRKVKARAQDILLSAEGSVGFDGQMEIGGDLFFSTDRTRRLVEDQRALRYVISSDGRLVIPFRITGAPGDFSVIPDGEYLARQIRRNAGGQGEKKTEERLEKRLPPPLRNLLEDLFKKVR